MGKTREIPRTSAKRIASWHHGLSQPVWTVHEESFLPRPTTDARSTKPTSADDDERSSMERPE